MKTGIRFEIIYTDLPSMIELEIRASNEDFKGRTKIYAIPEFPSQFAALLRNFPENHQDKRIIELGSCKEGVEGGGGARFTFYCKNRLRHIEVIVQLKTDPHFGSREEVMVVIPLEIEALHQFINALEHIDLKVGASAFLGLAT